MKVSELEDEPEPEEDEPEEDEPEEPEPPAAEPPLTVDPPGRVSVAPLVEKTTLPFLSVRYTDIPAEDRLPSAVSVGCP